MGPVGDEHHLVPAAVGEDDEVAGLGRALQEDLVIGGGQLVGLLPEGEGLGIHMALHNRLIYGHVYNSSSDGRDLRRPSGTTTRSSRPGRGRRWACCRGVMTRPRQNPGLRPGKVDRR